MIYSHMPFVILKMETEFMIFLRILAFKNSIHYKLNRLKKTQYMSGGRTPASPAARMIRGDVQNSVWSFLNIGPYKNVTTGK